MALSRMRTSVGDNLDIYRLGPFQQSQTRAPLNRFGLSIAQAKPHGSGSAKLRDSTKRTFQRISQRPYVSPKTFAFRRSCVCALPVTSFFAARPSIGRPVLSLAQETPRGYLGALAQFHAICWPPLTLPTLGVYRSLLQIMACPDLKPQYSSVPAFD